MVLDYRVVTLSRVILPTLSKAWSPILRCWTARWCVSCSTYPAVAPPTLTHYMQDTVEVFFDAFHEAKDAKLSCYFYNETIDQAVHSLSSLTTPGKLIQTDHWINDRELTKELPHVDMKWSVGFMLECPSVSLSVQTVGLLHDGSWTRVPMTPISMAFAGSIGACAGPLYTHRPLLLPWLTYYRSNLVQHFYLYHANYTIEPELSRALGIFSSAELTAAAGVQYLSSSDIDWLVFQPATVRFYAGESNLTTAQKLMSMLSLHACCTSRTELPVTAC